MKNKICALLILLTAITFGSCDDWLTQEDQSAMGTTQTYSSIASISSVAANLYSRLNYPQDFFTDAQSLDLTTWDEACNSSAYWASAANKNQDYRQYYDYTLIRYVNAHIQSLHKDISPSIPEVNKRYFLAEARYIRAFVYFTLVSRMGGVPIIKEVQEYTLDPLTLSRPRNKESEVYDFICSELDEITDDLSLASASLTTRATKGSALALKCRAMLYAGTIAHNYEKNATKGLILPSGVTGIDKSKANEYLQKSLDAYFELEKMGRYFLYKANANLVSNYTDLFLKKVSNPEIILCKDYDGQNFLNYFTSRAICRALKPSPKSGSEISPTLNLVEAYENISTRSQQSINPYAGDIQVESMGISSSTYDYKIYDNPEDIFADRDPRLNATIMHPGSSFRGNSLDFQAGLAVKSGNKYEFKSVQIMDDYLDAAKGYYNGVQMTGTEGPHRSSTNVSHTGFLIRKYVDTASGSEASGSSSVPYIIFRYGEVLLNAAEAAFYLNENGITTYKDNSMRQLALDCINQIRRRAGGDSFAITDAELSFNRIVSERRIELAFEDHRYNDLKRWRLADEIWNNNPDSHTAVLYGLWPYKIYAPGESVDGKWLYRKVKLDFRSLPVYFDLKMYYAAYPINNGNPYIEKNPNH